MRPLRGARAACVFLTRVPVGGFPYTPDEWRWAPAFFPLVGAAVGGVVAAAYRALLPLGTGAAALLAIALSLLLTGAFHEDGLADTADALGGAADRAKVFLILKDSRVGAFGACAIVASIGARAALVAHLGPSRAAALVVVGAVARAAAVWLLALMPYVTPEGVAKSEGIARARTPQAAVASVIAIAIGAALVAIGVVDALRLIVAMALVAILGVITAARYRARLGGITGDFLGATEQLCEIASLAAFAWGAP